MALPVGDAAHPEAARRPNVLALPSPTTSRFILLVAALLSSGLFVGTSIHNQMPVAADWFARVSECESRRPPAAGLSDMLAAEQAFQQCVAGVQQRLAWYAVGGVLLAFVAAVGVLAVIPGIIVRRRRLRPAEPRLEATSQCVASLAADFGLRQQPRTMVGPSTQRDAFSYGLPGRYAVALPPALAVRSTSPAFAPLVRHELAHVANRDVLVAWSARALWYVIGALLLLPIVLDIARADLGLLPSYAWRAALLLLATVVASAGILRSREYVADLRSVRTREHREALSALLATAGRSQPSGVRRLVMLHPDAARRVSVLAHPELLARPSAVEAGIAGFLAALTVPLLVSVFATVPALTAWAYVVPAALIGPVVGATVGVALWRAALTDVVVGTRTLQHGARRVAIGISVGFLGGQVASLAAVGTTTLTGARSLLVLVMVAVGVGGTTVVVAGVGGVVADRSAQLSALGYTTVTLAVSGTLFALTLWAVTALSRALDLGGWSMAGLVAANVLTQPAAAAVAIALGVGTLVLVVLPADGHPAGWSVEGEAGPEPPRVGPLVRAWHPLAAALLAGTGAAASILAFRLATGPAADYAQQMQRFDAYVWVFAGAGAAAGLSLVTFRGLPGAGAGVLAAPLASAVAATGFVIVNAFFGGTPTLEFLGAVVRPAPPLGLLLFVLASMLALLLPSGPSGGRHVWLLVVLPALLSTTLAFTAISAREVISPLPQMTTAVMPDDVYLDSYAPSVASQLSSLDQVTAAIDADAQLSPAERAERIRTDIVRPLDVLVEQAATVRPRSRRLIDAHSALTAGLMDSRDAFESFARAYETEDAELFTRTQVVRANAQERLAAWLDALTPP